MIYAVVGLSIMGAIVGLGVYAILVLTGWACEAIRKAEDGD